MKLNFNISMFVWLIHIISYYIIFGLVFQVLSYYNLGWSFNMELVGQILFSPIAGAFGFYDGFPVYFIFPLISFIIFNKIFNQNLYKSYLYSVLIFYVVVKYLVYKLYGYTFYTNFYRRDDKLPFNVNMLLLFVPSILTSAFFVKLYLKKKQSKLK